MGTSDNKHRGPTPVGGITTGVKPWIRQVLSMGCGLFVLLVITGSLGNLSRTLEATLAAGGLLATVLVLPRRPGPIPAWRLALSLGIMAASLPMAARGEPLGLLGAALFFFGFSLLAEGEGLGAITALLLTALLFACGRILLSYTPLLWHVQQGLAVIFSWFVGVGLRLGATALGLPILTSFALYAVSAFLLSISNPTVGRESQAGGPGRQRWRAALVLAGWLSGLVLAAVAFIWLQPPLGSWLLSHWPASASPSAVTGTLPTLTYMESLPLLFGFSWLVSALGSLALRPGPLPLIPATGTRSWTIAGLGLLALATAILTLDPPTHPRRGTILVHDTGHLDWGRPVFGQYGPHSGGTFGLLPDYLQAYGYEMQAGSLTAENLETAQAVVLINLPANLSEEEKDRLLRFVEAGGGLIIWGEHTGVGRIREPINDLLGRLPGVPLQLRFDSAVPVRQGWAEGLTLRPHPALYAVRDPVDLVIAVGASLQVKAPRGFSAPWAQPIIVGRFGHSDQGDASNQARNYVGDMRYNPGERLGDVVLAAEVQHGLGRIVVVGDTTPLGSVNLMTTMPFHARLLDWVTSERPAGWDLLLRNGWLAALLFAAAAACLARGRSMLTLAGAALVMALVLILNRHLNTAGDPLPASGIAYVDVSHQERFDRLLWEDTSIGGLGYNLVRNDTLPLLLREIDARALAVADLLVIIAPGQPFSAREAEIIARWVEDGGRLLVSVGSEEQEGSQELLAAFGLSVGHIPLGPVEVVRDMAASRTTGLVRFHEAWPVNAGQETSQTIVEGYGYPLAVYQPWGQGGVALIGDSGFLLGATLEGQSTYQEGNILLLQDILQTYLRVGAAP